MKAYQIRVVQEKRELDRRLLKLIKFLLSEKSRTSIPHYERERMQKQKAAMEEYSEALGDRITNFEVA